MGDVGDDGVGQGGVEKERERVRVMSFVCTFIRSSVVGASVGEVSSFV